MSIKQKIKVKKPIPMTREEEYRNADVPMPEEKKDYNGAKAYSAFLKLFFKGKK